MRPDNRFISADHAIEYWKSLDYSCEHIHLQGFEVYECGHLENTELKSQYDHLLLADIGYFFEFYSIQNLEKNYKKICLSSLDFLDWIENWYYDDDLIIQSNNELVTVFHHSGCIFYLRSKKHARSA